MTPSRYHPLRRTLPLLLLPLAVIVAATTPGSTAGADPGRGRNGAGRDNKITEMAVAEAAELPSPPPPPGPPPIRPPRTDDPRLAAAPAPTAPATADTAKRQPATATATASSLAATLAAAPTVATTLVLYDSTGTWGWLGELYGQQTANLVSHFGTWRAKPMAQYTAGEMAGYNAVVYLGSTFDEQVPTAFLNDVLSGAKPVLWANSNVWQLVAQSPTFAADHGFTTTFYDTAPVSTVRYKNTDLSRDLLNGGGIMGIQVTDAARAQVLATAVKADGSSIPWAVRGGNVTYLSEIPFSYVGHNDRYLAFADLLFDLLAPATPERHRALVRIEDVGPDADPDELRAIADVLSARGVPFSVAVYAGYRNPMGVNNNNVAQSYDLTARPLVVAALKYMQTKGGTLLMHGYTHQYSNLNPIQACPDLPGRSGPCNPYSGESASDFEFFRAHVNASNSVIYDGPVNGDTATMVNNRITSAFNQFSRTGLGAPTIFEPPHYAASALDYRTIATRFTTRYDRGLYFGGLLSGGAPNYTRLNGQFFPYPVRDLYGSLVIPENLGNVEPEPFNNHPARLPADILDTARRNLVIRDGFASFFYHPYLGTDMLVQVVDGLKAQGYTFTAPGAVGL